MRPCPELVGQWLTSWSPSCLTTRPWTYWTRCLNDVLPIFLSVYVAFTRWPNTGRRQQRSRRRRRSIGSRTGNWVGQASPDKCLTVL